MVVKTLPQHDLCNLLCISLSCNSVISFPTGCFGVWGAAGIPAFFHSSCYCKQLRKLGVGDHYYSDVSSNLKQVFWPDFRSIRNQPFWSTKPARNKADLRLINCSRLITKDLRAYLETATKNPATMSWEVKGADEEKLQTSKKIELGLGQWNRNGIAEGNGKKDSDGQGGKGKGRRRW